MPIDLAQRSLVKLDDLSRAEIEHLIDLAAALKRAKADKIERPRLTGKNIALLFDKPSTRTRAAFEIAAHDEGAHVTYLGPHDSQLGHKESIKDTARVLGRLYDGIEYRGFRQEDVEILARHAGVPVWNGLSDERHPTQALGDFLTMREHARAPLADIAFAFLGHTGGNVASSLLIGATKLGMDIRLAGPASLKPSATLLERARELSRASGARITVTEEIAEAVRGAAFVYTDVWISMGDAPDVWDARAAALRPYRVTAEVMAATGRADAKFMHCLPAVHNRETEMGEEAHRRYGLDGMEVAEEVFESPASIVFDQAENRMHTIRALLVATLGG
jgi:ornithine carbamoyltransferase